jgi:PAS domain S-box-containing protein
MKNVQLSDLINVAELQQMQDLFSNATGVASVITTPDGMPITRPSNFCDLCNNIIRKTEKGLLNCMKSDAELGKQNLNGPRISTCLSGGLWDAGVSISVAGMHLANWLIGQVRNESQKYEDILQYADIIGANRDEFAEALRQVSVMSTDQFKKVADMLYVFANQLSEKAHTNYLLKQSIEQFKKKEEELEWERTLLNALLKNMPDHIYFKDRESRFLRSNQSQVEHFGLSDTLDVLGKTDFDFFSHEHASEAFRDEQLIIETGISISKEEKETWNDRPDTWVSTTKIPLYDNDGAIIGTMGISRDITQKRIMEEQILLSEMRFRTIIENMGEGIGILSEKLEFTFTNPMAEVIFGVEKGTLTGKNLMEFIDDSTNSDILQQLVWRNRFNKSIYEVDIKRPNGEQRSLLVSSVPKRDSAGNFIGYYELFNDITKRKKDELTIQKQNQKLKEANTQKDKLFSIIAHDLRSPFNSFLGLTEIMEKSLDHLTRDQLQKLATNMKTSASRLYELLTNLLEWSRVQRGLINVVPQKLCLNELVQNCLEVHQEIASNKSIEIRNSIPYRFELMADPNMLQVVVNNLLTNALKFTPNQGTISIAAKRIDGQSVEVQISDTGIGMNSSLLSNLFTFDKNVVRQGLYNEPSTGLGLIVCKEFIEKHNGRIWAESSEGSGTTFFFTLEYQMN